MKKEKKSLLFCEQKRSKKNFDFFVVTGTVEHTREAEQKFFGSFFQKRTAFF